MKKIFIHAILWIGFSLSCHALDATSLEDSFVKIGEQVGPAVVTISVVQTVGSNFQPGNQGGDPFFEDFIYRYFGGRPQEYKQKGMGSGFIIDKDGHILTNDHVIHNADEIEVTLPDGRNFKATLMGSDPRSDIALIKIRGDNLPFIPLGDSDAVKPGQWSLALGNPFGNIVNNPKPTITAGIISAVHRTIDVREADRMYGDLIQTDAAINQGNSGGPLVNIKGEVIAINTLIFSPSGGNVGIGFAIPINRGKAILNDLISGKEIKHGYLGLWLQDLNPDIMLQLGLSPDQQGALIFKVEKNSPAQDCGFESGDIMTEIHGQPIKNSLDVTRVVSGMRPGEKVDCKILRNAQTKNIEIIIGSRKTEETAAVRKHKADSKPVEWRGITVESITDDIAKEFNLPSKDGVIVTRVGFGSPAYNVRINPGDIIYYIGQQQINNLADFKTAASRFTKGNVLLHTSRGYVVVFDENR